METVRQKFQEFIEKIEEMLNKLQNNIEKIFKSRFEQLSTLRESLQEKEKGSYAYEYQYTDFGKEREYLVNLHKEIFEKEKQDVEGLKILIQNMFNDYDEVIRKYHGIVPLDYSTHIVPDKGHAEEGREIEAEILQFFPSNCQREHITQHVTEIVKHIQETSFPDTPIWVKVTQHKEK